MTNIKPLIPGDELRCSGRDNSSCSTNDTRSVTAKRQEHHLIWILRDSIVNTFPWLLDEILSLLSCPGQSKRHSNKIKYKHNIINWIEPYHFFFAPSTRLIWILWFCVIESLLCKESRQWKTRGLLLHQVYWIWFLSSKMYHWEESVE